MLLNHMDSQLVSLNSPIYLNSLVIPPRPSPIDVGVVTMRMKSAVSEG